MNNIDAIKDKLRKLFRVAENDASTDGEIDNALRAAECIMNTYNLERDDVFEGEDGEVNVTNLSFTRVYRYSKYQTLSGWEASLISFVNKFVPSTQAYVQRGAIRRNEYGMAANSRATAIVFFGPEMDTIWAAEVFDEVVTFIVAAATLRYGAALHRGMAAAYAEGFCMSLLDSVTRTQAQLRSTSDSRALVVVNRSKAMCEASRNWLQSEHNVRLGRARRMSSSASWRHGDAYSQGRADGVGYSPSATKKAGFLNG